MKIQLRRDTAANWTANDPILLHGEVGIETDTLKIKFGDGVSAWSALGYLVAAASPGGGEGYIQYNNAGSIDGDPQITWNDTTNTLRVSGAISGAAISGGAIRGNWIGNQITSSYIIGYIASTNATGRFADSSNIRLRFPASANIYNRSWVDTFSGNIDTRIDSLESDLFDHDNYITSSSAISRFADSSNIRLKYAGSSNIISRYAPSRAVRNGLQTITAAYGEISHGLPSTPSNWSIRPSGVLANFGINTKVDATKIYVYLTTMTNRNVYWYAST